MLIFKTPGNLEVKNSLLFGASVKNTDNPIGKFGTGLKYAIAGILRIGGSVRIKTKDSSYNFFSTTVDVRGTSVNRIDMDVIEPNNSYISELQITTDLGKHWEDWMYYRELYCNTLDEGGEVFVTDKLDTIEDGYTYILVESGILTNVHSNRYKYFISPERVKLCSTDIADVYPETSEYIFYRGVRVGKLRVPSLFTYNIKVDVDLSEDRVYKYSWDIDSNIKNTIGLSDNLVLINKFLTADEKLTYEGSLAFPVSPTQTFISHVEKVFKTGGTSKSGVRSFLKAYGTIEDLFESVPTTSLQKQQIKKSIQFLSKLGMDVTQEVKVAKLTAGTLGTVEDGVIYISPQVFEMGTKYVCGTIMEEYLHITTGYSDYTASFQNALIDKILTVGEILTKKPL